MKRRPLEETLLALRRVRQAPGSEESQRELRQVLGGEGAHAVARAAALVGELGLEALVPDLVAALPRFYEDPVRADPGYSAKTAIVEALLLGEEVMEEARRCMHCDRNQTTVAAGEKTDIGHAEAV